jgi:DNA-binding MarR family transcriptional regulator
MREPMPGDRRRVAVQLSQKGIALLSQVGPLIDLQYAYLEESCGKQIFADLLAVLDEFINLTGQPVKHVELP